MLANGQRRLQTLRVQQRVENASIALRGSSSPGAAYFVGCVALEGLSFETRSGWRSTSAQDAVDDVCCIFLRPRRLAWFCSDFFAPGVEEEEGAEFLSPPIAFCFSPRKRLCAVMRSSSLRASSGLPSKSWRWESGWALAK